MLTVRFYTDIGHYKGWCKLNHNILHGEVYNWLASGNVIKIANYVYTSPRDYAKARHVVNKIRYENF